MDSATLKIVRDAAYGIIEDMAGTVSGDGPCGISYIGWFVIILVIFVIVMACIQTMRPIGIRAGGDTPNTPSKTDASARSIRSHRSLSDYYTPDLTCGDVIGNTAQATGGNALCNSVEKFMDRFLTDRFTAEMAQEINSVADDLAYDVTELNYTKKKISELKGEPADNAASKLILDALIHYYIYSKTPNDISREAMEQDIATLELFADAGHVCYQAPIIARVSKLMNESLTPANKAKETKLPHLSPREYFRKVQVRANASSTTTTTTSSADTTTIDLLRAEVSKKNIELREATSEIETLKRKQSSDPYASGYAKTSSLSTSLALDDCHRERRALQEKIYEMRRDVERIAMAPRPDQGELAAARRRIDELSAANRQLEQQLRGVESSHRNENTQVAQLASQLRECEGVLNDVLNAQGSRERK
jgi:hypothetical protein